MSRLGWILVALVLAAGGVGGHLYYRLQYAAPAPRFESAEDEFLYGSIGNEDEAGVPYWIWLVLPRIFPEYLPAAGGYASIGVAARDGHDMPIGLSKVQIGVPRVGTNCALCHTATVRERRTEAPRIYPGAPGHQIGAQEYRRFLQAAAADPRFTASTILDEIARNVKLSFTDQLLYRFVLIPETRRRLLKETEAEAAAGATLPAWGRGRADVAGGLRRRLLHEPADTTAGASDVMALWHLEGRRADGYLWDRSAASLRETVQAKALLAGAPAAWLDREHAVWDRADANQPSSLKRLLDYLTDLAPPKYPFAVDAALAANGATLYAANCAQCHDAAGARAHVAIPIDEIGTDRGRLDAWNARSAAALNALGDGHGWKFSGFRQPSAGYVAPSLDGVWLTAPYLHNGSVPALADLLEYPANRPTRFWRGYDVYDQARVGFVSDGTEAQRLGTPFDTLKPGNGNGGHAYGTTLSADEKRALLEYLKTR